MALKAEHELHSRRRSRNIGVGLTLFGFVALMFALSIVKITEVGPIQGYDHVVRPELTVTSE